MKDAFGISKGLFGSPEKRANKTVERWASSPKGKKALALRAKQAGSINPEADVQTGMENWKKSK